MSNNRIHRRRAIVAAGAIGLSLALPVLAVPYAVVGAAGAGRCFSEVERVPARPVALVLGCPKYDSWSHEPSGYYRHRVEAAAAVLGSGTCCACALVIASVQTNAAARIVFIFIVLLLYL